MHAHATKGGARSTAILTCAIVVYGPSQKKSGVQLNLPIFMAISMVSLHCFSLLRHLIMYNGSAQMGHLKARSAWALCDELRTMLVNNACLPVHSLLILNQVLRIWDRAAIETLGVFFKLNLQYLHIFSDFFSFVLAWHYVLFVCLSGLHMLLMHLKFVRCVLARLLILLKVILESVSVESIVLRQTC